MKFIYWILLGITIFLSSLIILRTGSIEPRVDERIDLNWKFIKSDDPVFSSVNYDDSKWNNVSLPHDWMIQTEIKKENPSGTAGGFYTGGIGWYRKHLDLSANESKKQFYLVFDGVYMNADVWINGIYLGKHTYGYIGFHFDISEYIRTDTINIIAVRTDCSKLPVDRWYSGAGIYRHVKLVATEKLHFPIQNTKITTFEKNGERILRSSILIDNKEKKSKRFKIKSDLIAPDGRLINSTVSSSTIEGNGSLILTEEKIIPDARFWSDSSPDLYELKTFLIYKKRVSDNIQTNFGVRDIVFSPDSGFILNNRKVWLKGVCIHHDGGALGSAVPDATWEYRLKALKKIGVNALRLAHNPHSPEVLKLCDELGFYVIDEMYDKWELNKNGLKNNMNLLENYKEDLSYFVQRDMNHPSVIAWSMGNETYEQLLDPKAGIRWHKKLADITREIDTTRMITCGLDPGNPRDNVEIPSSYIHAEPLVSYNYRTDSFAIWHEKYPDLIWLASETKVYRESIKSNYREIDYSDNSWLDMDYFIAGQFIWSGIDYFGESEGWPNRSFYGGLLKTNGEIKPYAYYTQSIYSDEPMVKIVIVDNNIADTMNTSNNWQLPWLGAPLCRQWNFAKDEKINVIIFTNCQQVELTLNDSTLDKKTKTSYADGVIKVNMTYRAGIISALGYYTSPNGNVTIVKDSLVTAGKPTIIVMNSDKSQFIANGSDVVHIETHVADSAGIKYPNADNMINYELKGPGKIKVIDNGDPADKTPFGSSKKRLYKGSHLVIIQSTMEPGDLTINASAEGFIPAQLKVSSVPAKKKKLKK